MIIIPWVICCYKRLQMGVENSPDIFQHKMNNLFHGFEFIRAYIYNILILTKGYWIDHIQNISLTVNKMKEKVHKCNIEDSFLGQTEMEYLGFLVTRDEVKPINIKIEAITKMALPTSRKEIRNFIGVINYYCDMWPRRSHKLAPLNKWTSIKRNFKSTQVEQDGFD